MTYWRRNEETKDDIEERNRMNGGNKNKMWGTEWMMRSLTFIGTTT